MKKKVLIATAALTLLFGACKDKTKQVSNAARAEAGQYASEGDFAEQIRDYPRAESLFAKAVELDPEVVRYWKELGAVRRRQENISGAKKAYERARELSDAEYKRSGKKLVSAGLSSIEAYVLLGKHDEARKALDRLAKENANDPQLKSFVNNKLLDRMISDSAMKASAIK